MKSLKRILIVMLMLCASIVRAADAYDPAALAKTISPYLDDATLIVVHIDMTRVDLAPAAARIRELFPQIGTPAQQAQAKQDFEAGVAAANKWVADFTKAGGRDYFAVVSMSGFPEFPAYAVVPLKPGADGQAIAKLLGVGNSPELGVEAEVREGVVVWGRKTARDQMKTANPQPRPELSKAFEAAGDSAVQVLYAPSADTRKVLAELLPNPPQGPFANAGSTVTRGVEWLALSAATAPDLTAHVTIQSPDAPAATALADTLTRLVGIARDTIKGELARFPEMAKSVGDVDALAKAFIPAAAGDRLTMKLDADQSLKLAAIVLPAMAKARQQAKLVQSASNIRQILLGCIMYANDNRGEFPPDLKSMMKTADLPAAVLRRPELPDREVGYTYVKPAKLGNAAEVVVIYESFDAPPPSLNVGFADGHVELLNYSRFEQMLAASTKAQGVGN